MTPLQIDIGHPVAFDRFALVRPLIAASIGPVERNRCPQVQ
ncbi:hypothetical protein [Mycolicibacterium xanthum]|nr:hypothetical protein [Mycolicibacterium xanthum]